MKIQRGAALVEFAIIALLFFVILFGIIEFGRAWFTYNTLVEATRRGARVAAVCPPENIDNSTSKIQNIVLFNSPTSSAATGFLGLTPANVKIDYLRYNPANLNQIIDWTYMPTSDGGVVVGNIDDIAFVRVSIINFQRPLFIPGFSFVLNAANSDLIATTLPSESLGRETPTNPLAANARRCTFP